MTAKPKIFIRADGGTSIGMGHIVRSLALADMLRETFDFVFVLQETNQTVYDTIEEVVKSMVKLPSTADYNSDAERFIKHISKNDFVVLDGYHFKTGYQQTIKNNCYKLICIDDLHAWHQVADVVINHADGVAEISYSKEDYTKLCLGLKHILLRKPFLQPSAKTNIITSIKKVFISMGAADIDNITTKFTQVLVTLNGIEEIHLMLGAINPHLNEIDKLIELNKHIKIEKHFNINADKLRVLLEHCDVAICPASSISYECCATGIGLISGYTADNQKGILNGLLKHKSALSFGDLTTVSVTEICERFTKLMQEPSLLNELISNQKLMIDGKSPIRLLKVFKNLLPVQLSFRYATEADVDLYFKWANDEAVRLNSFNQSAIVYENHFNWFLSKLKDENCFFYLFQQQGEPVGQVRIQRGEETIIGISIAAAFRGKSLSSAMLMQACDDFLNRYPDEIIVAYIKVENIASYHSFKKAGFEDEGKVIVSGFNSFKLVKNLV